MMLSQAKHVQRKRPSAPSGFCNSSVSARSMKLRDRRAVLTLHGALGMAIQIKGTRAAQREILRTYVRLSIITRRRDYIAVLCAWSYRRKAKRANAGSRGTKRHGCFGYAGVPEKSKKAIQLKNFHFATSPGSYLWRSIPARGQAWYSKQRGNVARGSLMSTWQTGCLTATLTERWRRQNASRP